eukprot:gene5912-6843_t
MSTDQSIEKQQLQQQQQQGEDAVMDCGGGDIGSFRDYSLDDSLYSRQRYVLGDFAMSKLSKGDVFLSGLGGVGVEIAKNLVLAGLKSLTLHDVKTASVDDLSTQFYIDENQDIGRNRAAVSHPKLSELNPYVKVYHSTLTFNEILNDPNYLLQFKVHDKNGEETKETFISSISVANEAIVTCMENQMHQLESGDTITFREVQGMSEINGTRHQVKVINPNSFSIGDTSSFTPYTSGGIISDIKIVQSIDYKSMRESIPNPDFLDFDLVKDPRQLHIARQSLEIYKEKNGQQLPPAWNQDGWSQLVAIADLLNAEFKFVDSVNRDILKKVSYTARGKLCPLSSVLGGFAAQEALKSLTGKFTPLKQWLYIDCFELFPADGVTCGDGSSLRSRRASSQLICLGEAACNRLENSTLFMIGSGAIGCEMLKNYALLSVGCGDNGNITITDNDLIEKSNLNRQFLFRNNDINSPKSKTASLAVKRMNPTINIDAHQNKVDMHSDSIYTSDFYQTLDLVVSALDNVDARLFVDSKCVANKKPLLESGTLGTKGHVQVILPNLTESYASQKDPNEKQTPFCTLKSFPSNLDHCIQWSRDKFEKLYCINPSELDKFIREDGYIAIALCKSLSKLLKTYPKTFRDCVQFARIKFEKLFCHNVKQLLRTYPLDLKSKEGVPFWILPKRPPTPLEFSRDDEAHLSFVVETATLWANIYNIELPLTSEDTKALVYDEVVSVQVPPFVAKNKVIISDEKASAPVESFSYDQFIELTKSLEIQLAELKQDGSGSFGEQLCSQQFEKDDDSNHHIDFITATANLRARVYSITESDRYKVKLIAGKIIPAIATTTSVVSGLVSLELIKILCGLEGLDKYKNGFLNLALPCFSFSEPGEAPKIKVTNTFSCTLWDKWEIDRCDITVEEFIQ